MLIKNYLKKKGDLKHLIDFYKEEKKIMSENKVIDLTLQILKGLSDLHTRLIIHRLFFIFKIPKLL